MKTPNNKPKPKVKLRLNPKAPPPPPIEEEEEEEIMDEPEPIGGWIGPTGPLTDDEMEDRYLQRRQQYSYAEALQLEQQQQQLDNPNGIPPKLPPKTKPKTQPNTKPKAANKQTPTQQFHPKYQAAHQEHLQGNRGGKGFTPYSIHVNEIQNLPLPPALSNIIPLVFDTIEHQQQLRRAPYIDTPNTTEDSKTPNPLYSHRRTAQQRHRVQTFAAMWRILLIANHAAEPQHKLTDPQLIAVFGMFFPEHAGRKENTPNNWRKVFALPAPTDRHNLHYPAWAYSNHTQPTTFWQYLKLERITQKTPTPTAQTVIYRANNQGRLLEQLYPTPDTTPVYLPRMNQGYFSFLTENLSKPPRNRKPTNRKPLSDNKLNNHPNKG